MDIEQTDKGVICTLSVRTELSHVRLENSLMPELQEVLAVNELKGAGVVHPVRLYVAPCKYDRGSKEGTTSLHVGIVRVTETTEQKIIAAVRNVQERMVAAG